MSDATAAGPVSLAQPLAPLAIPAALAVMTLATVLALDARTMILLIVLWCVVWVAALSPRRVETWSAHGSRAVVAIGLAWTAMFAAMVVTQQSDTGLLRVVSTGWPGQVLVGASPAGQSAWNSNLAWLWWPTPDLGAPRMLRPDRCGANLLVWTMAAAIVTAALPQRRLPSLLRVLRVAAVVAAGLGLVFVPFDVVVYR